jgi:predicted GNAT family acetyltransferase
MIIRTLKSSDEDDVENFLKLYAESSMFLRSNIRKAGLKNEGKDYQGDYLGSFDEDGKLKGVIAHYWNNNLMFQAPDETAIKMLIDGFIKSAKRPISGYIGPDEQSKYIANVLNLDEQQFSTNARDDLYSLDLTQYSAPKSIDLACFKLVKAAQHQVELLTNWHYEYDQEALKASPSDKLLKEANITAQNMTKRDDAWVLEHKGKAVAMVSFNANLPDLVQIGGVWTPPEERCKGYARAAVLLSIIDAQSKGVRKAVLFADSPAAKRAYEAIGFQKIGHYRLALLKEPVTLK